MVTTTTTTRTNETNETKEKAHCMNFPRAFLIKVFSDFQFFFFSSAVIFGDSVASFRFYFCFWWVNHKCHFHVIGFVVGFIDALLPSAYCCCVLDYYYDYYLFVTVTFFLMLLNIRRQNKRISLLGVFRMREREWASVFVPWVRKMYRMCMYTFYVLFEQAKLIFAYERTNCLFCNLCQYIHIQS